MSEAVAERGTSGLGSAALTGLNGAMAVLCVLMALFVAVIAVLLFLLGVSEAIHWPQVGMRWSGPGWELHGAPALVTVNSDVCTSTAGHEVCRRVSSTHVAAVAFNVDSLVTLACAVIFILPLSALIYGLAQAAACFAALARRRWFDRRTITHLRDFAVGGLVFLAIRPVVNPVVLALNAGWGSLRHMTVTGGGFSMDLGPIPTLLTVVYATLLALITAVLAHARSVAEDHAQIV